MNINVPSVLSRGDNSAQQHTEGEIGTHAFQHLPSSPWKAFGALVSIVEEPPKKNTDRFKGQKPPHSRREKQYELGRPLTASENLSVPWPVFQDKVESISFVPRAVTRPRQPYGR